MSVDLAAHRVTVRAVVGLLTMALVSSTAGRGWALSLAPLVFAWAARARRRTVAAPVPTQGPRDVPIELRRLVLERDGRACRYHAEVGVLRTVHYESECPNVDPRSGVPLGCDADFEADHVVAYSRGGPTSAANVLTACRRCNRAKSDRDVLDFLADPGFEWAAP